MRRVCCGYVILTFVLIKRISSHLSYANVVATLALFVALGGTTVAATKLHGSQIKKGTITGKQIRTGSVPGNDLRRDSVTGRQVKEASLGVVPRAAAAVRAEVADRAGMATTAETAANANRLEGRTAASFLDRCGEGMRAYAGVCFELMARTSNTWPAAAKICGDAGGRLPRLDELEGFRQLPGITLDGTEHTANFFDMNGPSTGGEFTAGINDAGTLSSGFSYGVSHGKYRCVMPMSNTGGF